MKRFAVYLIVAFLVVCIGLVGFASPTYAALTFHSGFEMNSLFTEWDSVTGTPIIGMDMVKVGESADYGGVILALTSDSTYIYAAGSTTYTVWKIDPADMSKIDESDSYVGDINALTSDGSYIYAGGNQPLLDKVWKIDPSDMSKVDESAGYGGVIYALASDGTYVYAGGANTQKVWKIDPSDMSKIESADYGGTIWALAWDGTYIYAAGETTQTVWKLDPSDMSKIDESDDYGGFITALTFDGTYIYAAGGTTQKVWKIDPSTMDKVDESDGYGGAIYALTSDNSYVYAAGITTETVWKIAPSDMGKVGESDDYGGVIRALTSNGSHIYAAGYTTQTVWKLFPSWPIKTGDYSMRCDTTGGAATAYVSTSGLVYRSTFYLYIVTAPSVDCHINSNLKLATDRKLKWLDEATGGTVLGLNTWYRISVSYDTESPANVHIWINGDIELDITSDFTGGLTSVGVQTSCTADLYFDDVVLDNSTDLTDLGDIRVQRAMPDAVGEYAQYDTSSGYTNVNSWPNSDASFIEDNQGNPVRESYNIEGTTDLGIGGTDTINAVNVFIRGDRDGGGATDHMAMVRDDSSDYNSADLDFDGIAWYTWYHAVLPNGGAPWTVDRFNAFQIGAYHGGAQDQRVHSVLAMVAYTVSAVGAADISNAPSSKAFGNVNESSSYWSDGAAPEWPLDDTECYFTVTNNGDPCSITIVATNFTGGNGWTLTSGSPGSGTVRLKAGKSGDALEVNMVILTTSPQAFISGLVTTKKWEIKMETGIFTDGVGKTSTLTLAATLD